MNKEDFLHLDLVSNDSTITTGIIKKEDISAIIKHNNYAYIYMYGDDSVFRTAESYEDILIKMFNQ